jgi:conjugative relaxase-like TrwC/TraI family protein
VAVGLVKLSAGSGYEYLTRQVAALDATGRGRGSLADYYAAKGEAPGQWYGAGLAGVGLQAGDPVTAEQMRLLFGAGLDPVTGARLGQRYALYANAPTRFELEVGRRSASLLDARGLAPSASVPHVYRDRLRTGLAREWFTIQFGRAPSGPREVHAFIARSIAKPRTSVAGYDVTFSPVKSVSALWALADPVLAGHLRAAHEAAVADALAFVERRVLFTRQGHDGVRQVDTRGLVAALFVHRDSRAGDPDLHTHVAIANKVQTLDGSWLAIDGRVLYQAKVDASEVYTTSLQARLVGLGLGFVESGRDGRRPVSEVAGLDARLLVRWSSRWAAIERGVADLVGVFEADHERPPTPVERLALGEQATLATRPAKH